MRPSSVSRASPKVDRHDAMVEALDTELGRMFASMDPAVRERTVVLFMSDNGTPDYAVRWPHDSQRAKGSLYEGGVNVPLIVTGPVVGRRGSESHALVSALDFFPTVLELINVEAPPDRIIDGHSLLPLLEGRTVAERPIFFHQISEVRAVRLGPFKYHDRHQLFFGNPMNWPWAPMRERGPWLFDLSRDADESYDVSHTHPATADLLRRLLETRRAELRSNPRGWL